MKNSVLALTIVSAISSTNTFANGGKIHPPVNSNDSRLIVIENGGKIHPPTSSTNPVVINNGGKIHPPKSDSNNLVVINNGGKIHPPKTNNIIAQDSGTFSLSAIFSKYFSF